MMLPVDKEETPEEVAERTRKADLLASRSTRFEACYFPGWETPNPARDEEKLQALMESMERDGWQGPPLVADGSQLLTGSHRHEALYRIRHTDAAEEFEVLVVDVRELFRTAGLDFDALFSAAFSEERTDEVWEVYRYVLDQLPATYHDYFGLDIG